MRGRTFLLNVAVLAVALPVLPGPGPNSTWGYHEVASAERRAANRRRPMPREALPIYYEQGAGRAVSRQGTAFALTPTGSWATAAHVTDRCKRLHLVVNQRPSTATGGVVRIINRDVSVIQGGVPAPTALEIRRQMPDRGTTAYHMGFPMGRASVLGTRLMGETRAVRHGGHDETVLVWVQDWRTPHEDEALDGLSGGPVLDEQGRVVGVVSMANERRGRIMSSMSDSLHKTWARKQGSSAPQPDAAIPDRRAAIQRFQQLLNRGLIREVLCDV